MKEKRAKMLPRPLGSLNLHTYNLERDECIWCGPHHLSVRPGKWVQTQDEGGSYTAWSVAKEDYPPTPPEEEWW